MHENCKKNREEGRREGKKERKPQVFRHDTQSQTNYFFELSTLKSEEEILEEELKNKRKEKNTGRRLKEEKSKK